MADFPPGQERMLKELIGTFRCHVCRRGFERDHVRVAAHHEQLWIVSVRCGLCRNQQVFWVALKEKGGQEISRELSEVEEERFRAMSPVTGDDVLDMHEFLGGFDGDFERLFSR
jgi:hypothetical protein